MSSQDDVVISQLQAVSQLFSSYPLSGLFFQVSELTIQTKKMAGGQRKMFIYVVNPSEMDARRFARMKNVIWDQLLATKAEIIQSEAIFSFFVQNQEVILQSEIFVSVHFRGALK